MKPWEEPVFEICWLSARNKIKILHENFLLAPMLETNIFLDARVSIWSAVYMKTDRIKASIRVSSRESIEKLNK